MTSPNQSGQSLGLASVVMMASVLATGPPPVPIAPVPGDV